MHKNASGDNIVPVSKTSRDTTFYVNIFDRGFSINIKANEERLYRDGYQVFMQRVDKYKSQGHDNKEAISLTALDCLVAVQKGDQQLENVVKSLEHRIDDLDVILTQALES